MRGKTLRDLQDDDNDEDNDAKNNLYTGGEKSGLFMQGAPDKKSSDLVKDILEKAKEGGAAATASGSSSSSQPSKPTYFGGSGYTLGSDDTPSAKIESSSSSKDKGPADNSEPEEMGLAERTLTFWKNGFSIDDGELLDYEDPENKIALDHIKNGRAPLDFLGVKQNQEVEVKVAHRMTEDYQPPKKKFKGFSGTGNRLGAPTVPSPGGSTSTMPGAFPTSASASSEERPANVSTAQSSYFVDPALPVTSLQIRLADGTRMVAKFNHTHLVGELREFVRLARPGTGGFELMTTFPNKVLSDDKSTLKEAGLLNCAIVQKLV